MSATQVAPSVCDLEEGEQPTSAVWIQTLTYAFDERGDIRVTANYEKNGTPIWWGAPKVTVKHAGSEEALDLLYVAVSAIEGAAKRRGVHIMRLPKDL